MPPSGDAHEQPAHVVVVPVRDVQWGRRIFRAPEINLPAFEHNTSFPKLPLGPLFNRPSDDKSGDWLFPRK